MPNNFDMIKKKLTSMQPGSTNQFYPDSHGTIIRIPNQNSPTMPSPLAESFKPYRPIKKPVTHTHLNWW